MQGSLLSPIDRRVLCTIVKFVFIVTVFGDSTLSAPIKKTVFGEVEVALEVALCDVRYEEYFTSE